VLLLAPLAFASPALLRFPMTGTAWQATEFPDTDGNLTTLILGFAAFSLLIVVVGAWLVEMTRRVWSGRRPRPPGSPIDSTEDNGAH
jgi:hypothetical protein